MDLVTATNAAYMPFARALLASWRHQGGGRAYVYGVNLTTRHERQLREWGAVVHMEKTNRRNARGYLVCRRYRLAAEALSESSGLLVLDADTIARRQLSRLDAVCDGNRLVVCCRVSERRDRSTHGGCVYLGEKQVASRIASLCRDEWWSDQDALREVMSEIPYGCFDANHFCRNLNPNVVLWTASPRIRKNLEWQLSTQYWNQRFKQQIEARRYGERQERQKA